MLKSFAIALLDLACYFTLQYLLAPIDVLEAAELRANAG